MNSVFNPVLWVVVWLAFSSCKATATSPIDMARKCFEETGSNFGDVLRCYNQAHAAAPLQYTKMGREKKDGIERRSFRLISQDWSPHCLVVLGGWRHAVDIHIPPSPVAGKALLLINNGTNHTDHKEPIKEPSDFTQDTIIAIALRTQVVVVSVSNVPNQHLTYKDDGIARKGDDCMAHSWERFLKAPDSNPFMPLNVPMVLSVVKAMDLAEKELKPQKINQFIVSGISKRGWAAWLTAATDPRIVAVVPFVIDVLGLRAVLEHTTKTYGGNWPVAFYPYVKAGVLKQRNSKNFSSLTELIDPLQYEQRGRAPRLQMPKYIVSASSDEFFVPDAARYSFDKLQGDKTLRVAPNSGHYGIKDFVASSLITFLTRLKHSAPIPMIYTVHSENKLHGSEELSLQFSEKPSRVTRWTAHNPNARDFRLPCGTHYTATPVIAAGKMAKVKLETPKDGWMATFVEVEFSDGFIASTRVYITPDAKYPTTAPPVVEPYCKTIPAEKPIKAG